MDNISVACTCYLTCVLSKPTAYSCPWKTLVELWQENRRIPNFLSLQGFCLCVNLRRGAAEKSVETPLAIFFSSFSPSLFFVYTVCKKKSTLFWIYLQVVAMISLLASLSGSSVSSHCPRVSIIAYTPMCICRPWQLLSGCLNFMMDFLLVNHECQHRIDLLTSEAGGSLCTSAHTAGGLKCCLEARWLFGS